MGNLVYGIESGPVYIDRPLSNILNNARRGGISQYLKEFSLGTLL